MPNYLTHKFSQNYFTRLVYTAVHSQQTDIHLKYIPVSYNLHFHEKRLFDLSLDLQYVRR